MGRWLREPKAGARQRESKMYDFERQKQKFFAGKIDRREFLRRSALMGAMAVALAACGKKEEEQQSNAAGGTQTASVAPETPKKGGTLNIGIAGGSTTDSLDPTTYTDSMAFNVAFAIMNQLIETDPNNKQIPSLFKSWEASDGATKWVFKIQEGVTFHNGKALDADDIIYSINLHR